MRTSRGRWLWITPVVTLASAGTIGATTAYSQDTVSGDKPKPPAKELPIGPRDLTERRTALEGLPPGVTGTTIVRARFDDNGNIVPDPDPFYAITLNLPVGVPRVTDAFVSTCDAANAAKDQILNAEAGRVLARWRTWAIRAMSGWSR
jgi:hypothetical protein